MSSLESLGETLIPVIDKLQGILHGVRFMSYLVLVGSSRIGVNRERHDLNVYRLNCQTNGKSSCQRSQ